MAMGRVNLGNGAAKVKKMRGGGMTKKMRGGGMVKKLKDGSLPMTTVDGKKRFYLDMEAREFEVDPASGRELASIGVGKVNTPRSYIYIPNELAKQLKSYLENNCIIV